MRLDAGEFVAAMHKRRIPGSRTALFRFLERQGIAFRKVLHASKQERTDVARERWIREQGLLDSPHLVFINETSVNTNITCTYGPGPRSEWVTGRVPFAEWKTLTFVAALHCDGMTAPMMIKRR